MTVDKYFFKPIAQVYNVLPVEIRSGINNALLNIDSTLSVPNQILQGNFGEAAISVSRFAINSHSWNSWIIRSSNSSWY
jgi:phospholipid-binding lipoprotein MlaA